MKSPLDFKFGLCVMYPAPGVVERIGGDWDWLWLDGQHGQIAGYDKMLEMVRAGQAIGKPCFVRVPANERSWIGLAADMGPEGIIVPQVDSLDDATKAVLAAKFPPIGNRSYGGRRSIDRGGRGYYKDANVATKLICQIESPEALGAVEEIAALEGVDGLFLGPDDMVLRMGGFVEKSNFKSLEPALIQVASACRRSDKDCFCVAVGEEALSACRAAGVNYLVGGSDVGFLASGSRQSSERLRASLSESEGTVVSTY